MRFVCAHANCLRVVMMPGWRCHSHRERICVKSVHKSSREDRRALVLRLIASGISCRDIAAQAGITYQRVSQIAKEAGAPLRERVNKLRRHPQPSRFRYAESDRPRCPTCGEYVQCRGLTHLGQRRTFCIRCRKSGVWGNRLREPIKMGPEFYSRIGSLAAKARWGGEIRGGNYICREDLFYPFACQAFRDDGLVQKVNGLVRRSLPEQMRADVCQEIIVSVLEGTVTEEDLNQSLVERFIKEEFKKQGYAISLESPQFGGEKTLGQVLGVY